MCLFRLNILLKYLYASYVVDTILDTRIINEQCKQKSLHLWSLHGIYILFLCVYVCMCLDNGPFCRIHSIINGFKVLGTRSPKRVGVKKPTHCMSTRCQSRCTPTSAALPRPWTSWTPWWMMLSLWPLRPPSWCSTSANQEVQTAMCLLLPRSWPYTMSQGTRVVTKYISYKWPRAWRW